MTEYALEIPGLPRSRCIETASRAAADKQVGKTVAAARPGRPSRELAGEVDERIIDAASHVFLDRGFGGASINQIARLAHAGKGTVYAHFARSPIKEALFEAVMSRTAARWTDAFKLHAPIGVTPEDRLVSFATEILSNLLSSGTIDFARLCMAEAGQYPELPRLVRTARQQGADAILQALSELARGDEFGALPAFASERLPATTQYFFDLVVTPILLRAALGEDPNLLRTEIDAHVANSAAFFLAACRCADVD